jgi:hypothetical protein
MSRPDSRPRNVVNLEEDLDYSWWASDGPTAGYLTMTAIRVAWLVPGLTPYHHAESTSTCWPNRPRDLCTWRSTSSPARTVSACSS